MRCPTCGDELPSKHYLVTDMLCRSCFEKLPEEERKRLLLAVESLEKQEPGARIVADHPLRCPICEHERFWKRKTLMNTPGLTFFGVEWANRQAVNFVCERCGHVLWFLHGGPESAGD